MQFIGLEYVRSLVDGDPTPLKMVLNSHGALLLPATEEHRDQRAPGIVYGDDYRGNALAAILGNGRMDIRFHKGFSEIRVASLIEALASHADLSFLRQWRITYQGRELMRS
jgi:hypothetical protein